MGLGAGEQVWELQGGEDGRRRVPTEGSWTEGSMEMRGEGGEGTRGEDVRR